MRFYLAMLPVFLLGYFTTHAQFETVYIGVNGLTCSQCSRTVELSIRKLDFVSNVQMNLQHTEGTIALKKDKKTDIDKIAQAVLDAGFSVRYLRADLNIDNTVTSSGSCFNYNGDEYVLAQAPGGPLKGTVKLTFLGKKFLPKNEFKKVQPLMNAQCGSVAGKVYHVTPNP